MLHAGWARSSACQFPAARFVHGPARAELQAWTFWSLSLAYHGCGRNFSSIAMAVHRRQAHRPLKHEHGVRCSRPQLSEKRKCLATCSLSWHFHFCSAATTDCVRCKRLTEPSCTSCPLSADKYILQANSKPHTLHWPGLVPESMFGFPAMSVSPSTDCNRRRIRWEELRQRPPFPIQPWSALRLQAQKTDARK